MKKTMLMLGLALVCGLVGTSVFSVASNLHAQGVPAPTVESNGCHAKGVAVHTFYGNSPDVLRGLDRLPADLPTTRMYMVMVETADKAELRLYERAEGQTFRVSSWSGKEVGNLRHSLDKMMLQTRGSACAGEEMRKVLARDFTLRNETTTMPTATRVAFAPIVEKYTDGYMRVTLMHPCGGITGTTTNSAVVARHH